MGQYTSSEAKQRQCLRALDVDVQNGLSRSHHGVEPLLADAAGGRKQPLLFEHVARAEASDLADELVQSALSHLVISTLA